MDWATARPGKAVQGPMTWFLTIFWGLAVVAIGLGIVISADEYLTEQRYSSGSKGDDHGQAR